MKKTEEFPFDRARKVGASERQKFLKAYETTFGEKPPLRGRPTKVPSEKYRDIHIKIHPRALQWTTSEARRRGIGYQTVINETLLQHVVY